MKSTSSSKGTTLLELSENNEGYFDLFRNIHLILELRGCMFWAKWQGAWEENPYSWVLQYKEGRIKDSESEVVQV